jgi:hypothetical protein
LISTAQATTPFDSHDIAFRAHNPITIRTPGPPGRHDLLFRVVFGSNAAAARYFGVSRMTVWRWRHNRAPLPQRVIEVLPDLVQAKVAEAHLAQTELGYFLREPPPPMRKLSGCCAGRERKTKRLPQSAADWAALGY